MGAIKSLAEELLQEQAFDPSQIKMAQEKAPSHNQRLSSALVELGLCSTQQIASFVAKKYSLSFVDLSQLTIAPDVLRAATKFICEKYIIIPVNKNGTLLTLAISDPIVLAQADQIMSLLAHRLEFVVATEDQIRHAIVKFYKSDAAGTATSRHPLKPVPMAATAATPSTPTPENTSSRVSQSPGRPVTPVAPEMSNAQIDPTQFVNTILAEASKRKASDIHIETFDKRFRVRFRIDGSMQEVFQSSNMAAVSEIVARVKVLAKMDLAEKRRPLDGRARFQSAEGEMDLRISSMPTLFGEKIALRLLDQSNLRQDLTQVGFTKAQCEVFKRAIRKPQGMVLITGPTGSGKTTTIYSALSELNRPDINISTAEDPIEFVLDGINQVQINTEIDLTFAEALRSFLRQDPDVIMVGEIRDLDTANMAYKAASTGHLVVSTLHTNDSISTIRRLIEMGIPAFLLAEGTSIITAQRLLRRNCSFCKIEEHFAPTDLISIGVPAQRANEFVKTFKGRGCEKCGGTGYKGRIAVHEVLEITPRIREGIIKAIPMHELKHLAIAEGLMTVRMSALEKMREGFVSIQEVITGTVSDDRNE